MMKQFYFMLLMLAMVTMGAYAQRTMDKLDRGLVAVKTGSGIFCSWRIMGEEYYDVTYNIYRDGTKLNATPLNTSNFTDASGSTSSKYTVSAVVRGKEQAQCKAVTPWAQSYLEIVPDHSPLTSTFEPNDACMADVDGDGELELIIKMWNRTDANAGYPRGGANGEYNVIEVYKLNGKKLWWIDCGPNLGDFQFNETNIVAYDWDQDGKAEALMRGADGTTIHMADGTTQVIGDKSKNYRASSSSGQWFIHDGAEYLVYMNGETGKPYQVMDYPLTRESASAWGDGYGHRSSKYFFGAPYLDGRKPSIFLGRGIYTRHKFAAYDVDPNTHQLSERWRWECNDASSPWYGNGYHNYGVADVDWDGRDEIVWGSMVIDDNGRGLSTTGLGHGDAQHHGDFNPYVHGHEIFACNEDLPSNNYRDATTSKIYYRMAGGSDDGRGMCGNFSNDYPGCLGSSGHDTPISTVTNDHIDGLTTNIGLNFRIYWDGDLCDESFDGAETNGNGVVSKYRKSKSWTLPGSMTNNDTKKTPCYQGDILGDWREEVIMRTSDNRVRIYTTTEETPWRNYTLWHDMQYRNAMVWQMCGYNQPPHVSYFMGEMEGITMAPPALTMTDRTEVKNGGSIGSAANDQQVIMCETGDMTVSVSNGASPYIFFDNAPSWVQGTDVNGTSGKDAPINYEYYTHTLTGGPFGGSMRLVKQGDGALTLPNVTQTYSGPTDVWAGVLNFDGTMQNSRVWLNRFAELNSDGGKFPKSIQMDYAAILRPGGADKQGTVETDSLIMNFGSRLVMDVYSDGTADKLTANVLKIEKKDWQYGPEFLTPVFQIAAHYGGESDKLPEGKYLLATVGKVDGNIDDIVVTGVGAQKASLTYESGSIYLNIAGTREATTVIWEGGVDSNWNFAETENFKSESGEQNLFVAGDAVIFNDEAQVTTVNLVGDLTPASVTFDNSNKDFVLQGDGSIIGSGRLVKKNEGTVTINNVNKFEGGTLIRGGKVIVGSLGSSTGAEYGALGSSSAKIQLENGGILSATSSVSTSQPIALGLGGGVIEVPNGVTFTTDGQITATGKYVLTKTGAGTLKLGSKSSFGALYINEGQVNGSETDAVHAYPDSVVLNGGTLHDPDDIYSYSSNKTSYKVPEGKTSNWYLDSRCNYTGTLSGSGTLNVYATSVRNVIKGNWSAFRGTLNVGKSKTGSYDPEFYFANNNGLRYATVNVTGVFSNTDPNTSGSKFSVAIGDLKGSGTLSGAGRYTIGYLNQNITFTGKLNGCLITKVGSGLWTLTTLPTSIGSGNVEVKGGAMNLNNTAATDLFFGSNQVIVSDSGTIAGRGYVQKIDVQRGGTVAPGNYTASYPIGFIKVKESVFAYAGSHVNLFIYNANNTSSSRSYLDVGGTLSIDGDINVTMRNYTPKEGDEIILWTAKSFTGSPTAINLPDISSYNLAWDTSGLLAATGMLKVVQPTGVAGVRAEGTVNCSVYTMNGVKVTDFKADVKDVKAEILRLGVKPGTYIIRMNNGSRIETRKMTVK